MPKNSITFARSEPVEKPDYGLNEKAIFFKEKDGFFKKKCML